MEVYKNHPRILGLGEVMDAVSVLAADEDMLKKLELFSEKTLDGHAPFLPDKELTAYVLAGIATDHEASSYEYAMEEARRGMHVHIREGSAARNVEAVVKGIVEHHTPTDSFSFCTDDKHIEDIRRAGHISYNIKKAISLGLEPLKAIRMATINSAECYGLKHLGAIAPGRQADMLVVSSLEEMDIQQVFHKGVDISNIPIKITKPCPDELKHTVHIGAFTKKSLELKLTGDRQPVLELIPGQILTKYHEEALPGKDGVFIPDETYSKCAAVERHKGTGHVGIGAVRGAFIRNGAIASSVSHDSHNIIVLGDNDDDMELAVKKLAEIQGGYVVVSKGDILDLPLPVMGLMSDAGFEQVDKRLSVMIKKAHDMGIPDGMDPFITLSFMALPVIPEVRVTTRGVLRV